MTYVGKTAGDYKVLEKIGNNKYIYACTKCGEERVASKTLYYREPKCQKCGGRKNAVRFNYKGKLVSAKEIQKETGLSLTSIYKKGVRGD